MQPDYSTFMKKYNKKICDMSCHLTSELAKAKELSWLKLQLAQAKELELGWLGLARRLSQIPSLDRLGLKGI